MKKTDILLITGVVIVVVIALFATKGTNAQSDIELPLTLSGDVGLNKVSYDEYENHINNDDAILVVIERTGCSWCAKYLPIMEEVASTYQIPVLDIDIAELTDLERTKLNNSNRYLKTQDWGTPTTLLLKGSIVVDSIGGYVEKETLVSFIEENIKLS